jgi:catechol-2,3-dioxygenase
LSARIQQQGCATDGPPRALATPGGGYGFGFRNPEGRGFAIVCDVADRDNWEPVADRPRRLSHVNLNSHDNDASSQFMTTVLGFQLSDQTRQFCIIRCNEDHHALVLGFSENCFLNHIAFEMPDLDSLMRCVGRMRDQGYAVEWGPGRHGPGSNVFAYFCGPEEVPIECTSEMQQVNGNHQMRSRDRWTWPQGRLDQWGITPGPSARVKRSGQERAKPIFLLAGRLQDQSVNAKESAHIAK